MEEVKIPITMDDGGFGAGAKRIIDRMEATQKEVRKTGMTVDDFAKRMQVVYQRFDTLTEAVRENTAAVGRDSQAAKQLGRDLDETAGKGVTGFSRLEKAAIGFFTVQQAREFVGKVYEVRSEIEKLETSFRILVGDKSKADALFASIRKFAVETPMQLRDLAGAAQTMMGFGIDAGDVMENLKALGNVAMGDSQRFQSLALAFSQMSATGKLMGQDFLQMVNAGFNPLDQMARTTGKSVAELKDEMSNGAISADMVRQAFIDATSEGGKFNGMLEAQSKTLAGSYSNLQGAVDDMLNEIGEKSEGAFATAIEEGTNLVKNYEKVAAILQDIVVGYGLYKGALMAADVAQKAHAAVVQLTKRRYAELRTAQGLSAAAARAEAAQTNLLTVAKVRLTAATKSLTAALTANPYVLAAMAVAGLAFGIYKLATAEDAETAARRRANDEMQTFVNKLDEQKNKIQGYIQTLQDSNATEYQKAEAWEMLNKLAPTLTEKYSRAELATLDLAEATKHLNEEAEKVNYQHLRDEVKNWQETIARIRQSMLDDAKDNGGRNAAFNLQQLKGAEAQLDSYLQKLAETDRLRAKMAEDNKPLEIRIQEANQNAETKAEIYNFYKRAADLAGELKTAHDTAAGTIANSSIPQDYEAIADSARQKYDALIAELEEDVEALRTKIAKSPASLELAKELKGKEQALNDLLQMKREWAWSGATTIPLTFQLNFSKVEQALRDAQSGAGKNTAGMKWVPESVSLGGGHWEKDEAHADTRTAAQWRQEAYGNWKKAQKAVDAFWQKKESMDKATFDKEYERLKGTADQAKKDYDKLNAKTAGKGGRTGSSGGRNSVVEQRRAQQRYLELQREQALEQQRQAEDLAADTRQHEIDQMEEGNEKVLAQIRLDYERRKKEIARAYEDLKQEKTEAARKLWEADPGNKDKVFDASAVDTSYTKAETEEYTQALKANEKKRERAARAVYESEAQAMLDYMKEYGSMQDQRAAITKEYDEKIAAEGNAIQKAALAQQKQQALKELDFKEWQQTIDWEGVFNDLDKQTTKSLAGLKEKLRGALGTGDVTAENAKVLAEKIREIEDMLAERKDPFAAWLPGLRERVRLTNQVREAEDEVTAAAARSAAAFSKVIEQKKGIKGILDGIGATDATGQKIGIDLSAISADMKDTIFEMFHIDAASEAGKKLEAEFASLATTTINLGKAQEDVAAAQEKQARRQESLDHFAKGGGVAQYFKAVTDGLDIAGWANLINTNVQSMGELVDNIGLGSTEFGKGVKDFADGVSGFNNSIQALASGDVVGAINGIIDGFQGYGHLIERIGGFSFNGSNAAKVAETTERLTKANEALKVSIDGLKNEVSKSGGSQSIKSAQEALRAQREYIENQRDILKAQQGYHGHHHSNGANWNLDTNTRAMVNRLLAEYASQNDKTASRVGSDWASFSKLSPEEMDYIRVHSAELWQKLTDIGKYDKSEFFNAFADLAGSEQEILDSLKEAMTQTTFDSLKSSFISDLMDMEKSAEDFTDDFSKMMMEAMLNARISDLMDDELQKFYDKWSELSKDASGNGYELTEAELDELSHMWDGIVNQGLAIRDQVAAITGYGSSKKNSDQSASNVMADKATYEQFEAYLGIATATQIAVEQGNAVRQSILDSLAMMGSLTATGNEAVSELRSLAMTRNEYLLDIKKSNREILAAVKERMDDVVDLLEEIR